MKVKSVCNSCHGTGLYVGFAERDGAAVVCYDCNGTGCVEIEYEPFIQRKKPAPEIKRVFERNPGVKIGNDNGFNLEDFGGISVKDWIDGKPFPKGSEMRDRFCPLQWTGQDWKPSYCYDFCGIGSRIDECRNRPNMSGCWAEYDKEKKV